jgi:cellulose synthase/poly-beta-1,6-N-acetylglucosamine synthase-like glycosyltransferase
MEIKLLYVLGLIVLSGYYLLVILFFHKGFSRLGPGSGQSLSTFSIIIAARNEEARIGRCLNSVLLQDYPGDKYEVIVVNDRSTDKTGAMVGSFLPRRKNLRLINVTECPEGVSPKKNALAQGIREAAGEIILFTDADCIVPRTWVRTVNGHFAPGIAAVAGLTTYFKPASMPALFWGIQAMDFFSHSVVSAAAMGAGLPINTNANNFAVRRDLFHRLEGFKKVADIVSGDDDLILQALAREKDAKAEYAPEKGAAVETEPTPTLRGIWEQRKRWSSKTVYYNLKQALMLSGVFIYYFIILAGIFLSLFKPQIFPWIAGGFLFKTALDFTLAFRGMQMFGKTDLLRYFLPMALLHIPFIVFACLFGVFGKFAWKDGYVRKRLV